MSASARLDEALRSVLREVVREEIRAALDERATQDRHRNAGSRATTESYLSIARAATFADVAPGTLRRWIKAGRLPARRAGRVYRIARADLEALLLSSAARPTGVAERARRIVGAV